MKRSLLKTLACISLFAGFTSCSPESAVDLTTDAGAIDPNATEPNRQGRSSLWDGEIGIDRDTLFEITADKGFLLADLQIVADKEGASELIALEIVKKEALNDSNDTGYMLVASDSGAFSVGVMLKRTQSGMFMVDDGFGNPNPVAVSCKGCSSGCNLQYLYIDGKKVPICNENGCGSDCKKSEVEID